MRTIILMVLSIFPWIYTSSQQSVRENIITLAESQVGVIEASENWGPVIEEYLDSCGFSYPVPWCACYNTWVYKCLGLATPDFPARASHWTETNAYKYKEQAISGDVFTIYYSTLGRVGHTGIIEAVDADYVYTIEGNTGGSNSKEWEGDRVMKRVRPWATIYKTSNWVGNYYHTVKQGENLYRISLKYNTTVERIKQLNNIKENYIKIGQQLQIY